MKTIFVSYSQPDEGIGTSIVERLKQEGFVVWFAPKELQPGASFAEIFDQIDRCDAFVVLLSRNSAKSPWVNKELDVAITRQLSSRPLVLIPVYLESMDPLRKVADLKPVDLHVGQWDKALGLLIAQLQGREKNDESALQGFEHFLNNLVRIDDAQFEKVKKALLLASMARPEGRVASDGAMRTVQAEIQSRALDGLAQLLDEAEISKEDCMRVLEAAKRGVELPIVNRFHLAELRRFARRSDDTIIRLAGELWQIRDKQGITLVWLEGWLADYLREHFSIEDEELLGWKAEALIDQARTAGLLVRSAERPWGYAERDAESNPSYDLGPMARIAGRLVSAFTTERQQLVS
jgi:hypothetical protein